jgi:hypothetical protein
MWLRVALMLLALNLIVAVAVRSFGQQHQQPPTPPPPPPQKTAGSRHMELREVTVMKFDSFDRRWEPIGSALSAPDVEVRATVPPTQGTLGTAVADKVPVVVEDAGRATPPRHRRSSERADVCAKHGMRRVNYTKPNGWKYWRCRR